MLELMNMNISGLIAEVLPPLLPPPLKLHPPPKPKLCLPSFLNSCLLVMFFGHRHPPLRRLILNMSPSRPLSQQIQKSDMTEDGSSE
jgi:hypothetical protein